MSEVDTEVAFKEDDSENEESTPPNPITTCDMDVIIRGWEEKFARISECLREVQAASERANVSGQPRSTCSGGATGATVTDHAGGAPGLSTKI